MKNFFLSLIRMYSEILCILTERQLEISALHSKMTRVTIDAFYFSTRTTLARSLARSLVLCGAILSLPV